MSYRKLKWHHLGLIPGLLMLGIAIYWMVVVIRDDLRIPSFGLYGCLQDLEFMIPSLLPGVFLIFIYLAALRPFDLCKHNTVSLQLFNH